VRKLATWVRYCSLLYSILTLSQQQLLLCTRHEQVSHQVYGVVDKHMAVRRACVDHMLAEGDRFSTFIAEDFQGYARRMRRAGVWGDDVEIRSLEEVFDRPIQIYSADAAGAALLPMKTDFETDCKDKDSSSSSAAVTATGERSADSAAAAATATTATTAADADADSTAVTAAAVAPIKLSYHGFNHYNSVIDSQLSYPLQPMSTHDLLQQRQKQYADSPSSSSGGGTPKRTSIGFSFLHSWRTSSLTGGLNASV
jgi:OTU-like cysteine protease